MSLYPYLFYTQHVGFFSFSPTVDYLICSNMFRLEQPEVKKQENKAQFGVSDRKLIGFSIFNPSGHPAYGFYNRYNRSKQLFSSLFKFMATWTLNLHHNIPTVRLAEIVCKVYRLSI